ncbi:hypothetical protein PHLCEN_2v250 [Hermanssonia centrifuga]|uniref:Uncharacterized protein n=1 Tax=Hermanssonia centrifuga TaxID=98765 RepID=A0A2R6S6J7_9APHY|nr:hypothetical protein PHLCEN_2v250 [Hermanssonia centrifuga]
MDLDAMQQRRTNIGHETWQLGGFGSDADELAKVETSEVVWIPIDDDGRKS